LALCTLQVQFFSVLKGAVAIEATAAPNNGSPAARASEVLFMRQGSDQVAAQANIVWDTVWAE
jgi:hypothetical protein